MSHPNYKSHTPIKKSNTYSIILEKKIKPNSTCLELIIKTVSMTTYSLVQRFVYTFDALWSQIYFIPHQKCIQIAGPNCK